MVASKIFSGRPEGQSPPLSHVQNQAEGDSVFDVFVDCDVGLNIRVYCCQYSEQIVIASFQLGLDFLLEIGKSYSTFQHFRILSSFLRMIFSTLFNRYAVGSSRKKAEIQIVQVILLSNQFTESFSDGDVQETLKFVEKAISPFV